MISMGGKGDFSKTRKFLESMKRRTHLTDLDKYGRMGVDALSKATPRRTGNAAESWEYRIIRDDRRARIEWYNTDVDAQGTPIVILIQYGHGTKNGAYLQGRDFINPAMQPVFDKITEDVWEKVKSA